MKKKTENKAADTRKAELSKLAEERNAVTAERREAEKILAEAFRMDKRANDAARILAVADITGKVPAAFARLVLRMGPALELAAKNPQGVRVVLKNYEAELEKDKNAREFRAPSKGIRVILAKILEETWGRVETIHADTAALREKLHAASVAYAAARAAK